MNLRKFHFNSIFIGATLLAVAACSGMSPGGGAPGGVGGALDGGNGDASGVGGGSGLPGGPLGDSGGGAGGEAVPSTQQSSDSIGGGCARSYQVKLKVLHNGSEEACNAMTARVYGGDVSVPTSGGVFDEVETDGDPKVTVTLGLPVTRPLVCISGVWQTAEPVFFRAVCSNYDVTAVASWQRKGKSYSSDTYQGAPIPPPDYQPIPIDVTIDLGKDIPANHIQFEDSSINALE